VPSPKCEQGVVVGNTYDKYGTRNPVARNLMEGFLSSFDQLVARAEPRSVLEVGCGPGDLSLRMSRQGYDVLGTDISGRMIREARKRVVDGGDKARFERIDLFDLEPEAGRYDLVVCCEVLEHLNEPEEAMCHLSRLTRAHLLFSVPWEPIWRILNLARGRYWRSWGNTPGHLQHWSRQAFLDLLDTHLDVDEVRTPFPWTMALARLPAKQPTESAPCKNGVDE